MSWFSFSLNSSPTVVNNGAHDQGAKGTSEVAQCRRGMALEDSSKPQSISSRRSTTANSLEGHFEKSIVSTPRSLMTINRANSMPCSLQSVWDLSVGSRQPLGFTNMNLLSPKFRSYQDKVAIDNNSSKPFRSSKEKTNPHTDSFDSSIYSDDLFFNFGVSDDINAPYRPTMEDAFIATTNINLNSNTQQICKNALFAIFDGFAGNEASRWCKHNFVPLLISEIASKRYHSTSSELDLSTLDLDRVSTQPQTQPQPQSPNNINDIGLETILNSTFKKINKELTNQLVDVNNKAGCTAAIVFLELDNEDEISSAVTNQHIHLYTANVGDTRIVLGYKNKAYRLTTDHKVINTDESDRIVESGGYIWNGRVNGLLAITRALGGETMLHDGGISCNPKVSRLDIPIVISHHNEDKDGLFLILGCDGIWDVISDQEAVELIQDINDCKEASQLLVEKAIERGSMDNVTCIVVRLNTQISIPTDISSITDLIKHKDFAENKIKSQPNLKNLSWSPNFTYRETFSFPPKPQSLPKNVYRERIHPPIKCDITSNTSSVNESRRRYSSYNRKVSIDPEHEHYNYYYGKYRYGGIRHDSAVTFSDDGDEECAIASDEDDN